MLVIMLWGDSQLLQDFSGFNSTRKGDFIDIRVYTLHQWAYCQIWNALEQVIRTISRDSY